MKDTAYQLAIYTKNDFSDKSIINFLKENENPSIGEYSDFLSSREIGSRLAADILDLIKDYDTGFLKPDKCDAYEPIKEKFLEEDMKKPIKWLSQPGGAFYFKQTKGARIDGFIDNLRFAPIWHGGKIIKPVADQPTYLGELRLYFNEKIFTKKGIEYWDLLLKELCTTLGLSFGFLSTKQIGLEEIQNGALNNENILLKYPSDFKELRNQNER